MRNKVIQSAGRVARNSLDKLDKAENLSGAMKQAAQLRYRLNYTISDMDDYFPSTNAVDGALLRMGGTLQTDIKNSKEEGNARSKNSEQIRAKAASVRMLHKATEESFVKKLFGGKESYEEASKSYLEMARHNAFGRDR